MENQHENHKMLNCGKVNIGHIASHANTIVNCLTACSINPIDELAIASYAVVNRASRTRFRNKSYYYRHLILTNNLGNSCH